MVARLSASKGKNGSSAKGAQGISRRPLQNVDVNVTSYDRTDPFTALNVLRKLFASLPARMGGCQFKFSPEEHKLSMHLLTIVEPFVGLSPSRRTLTRQPTEILDAIAFHVESKRDLLALALSCRRMHSVVFPRHYDYRLIRCKVSSISVWNHLIVNRSLARNVRRLEILDERTTCSELIPHDILTTDTDLESTDDELGMHAKHERLLISALTRMTALRGIGWSCNHSLVSIHNVWPVLLKCQTLQDIEINDNLIFSPTEVQEKDGSTSKVKRSVVLPELRTVALQSSKATYGSTKRPDLSKISAMLHSCPNLEILDIGYAQRRGADHLNPVVDDLVLCGRWPKLRSLTFSNLWCSPHAGLDAAAAFLATHVNLQVLHLDLSVGATAAGGATSRAQMVLPPNSLPCLRELKSSREFAGAVLQCPCSVPGGRPLETIKGIRLSGSGWDEVFLGSLKRYGASAVKRIELAGWNEMEDLRKLVESAPKLTWLDVGKRGGSNAPAGAAIGSQSSGQAIAGKAAPMIYTNVVEWATLLAQLPDLTAFHGVRLFYEVNSTDPSGPMTLSERSRVKKNEEIASVLAWKCPKLRRLDHWEEGSAKIVVLVRDGEKAKYEVRRVKT